MKENNRISLLKKLIDNTRNKSITWEKIFIKNEPYWSCFKGIKKVTEGKHMEFILKFYSGMSEMMLHVHFINDLTKTKDLIFKVEPGFFSWKTTDYLDKLIVAINQSDYTVVKKSAEIDAKVRKFSDDFNSRDTKPLKSVWERDQD